MKSYSVRPSAPEHVRKNLASYPEFLRNLLWARGVSDAEEAERFLHPSYEEHTHDPFLIGGMERAVGRILKGIRDRERITIWSDYDHDGIPGGVILHDFFQRIGYQNFTNYIPHRYTEGYGLNSDAIEKLCEDGTTLLITVDCGISDVGPVERANELGIDVIITDHHLTQTTLPPAYAILNSKQEDCEYPFNMLCGAAVAFKLVQALLSRGSFDVPPGWEKWLLDLVGFSTIADMVPLHGENRVLAHFGLMVLRKTRRAGLLKLMRLVRVDSRFLTEDDIGFMLAPRINAASRMGDPRLAFELLASSGENDRSETLAVELDRLNNMRRGVVAGMVREMKHTLAARTPTPSVIVIGNPAWRPGLLGLAANTIMEEHERPVFLWGREGGTALKGSCRSDGTVDVVELMGAVPSGIFVEFGGHELSGGFSVYPEKIHYLEQSVVKAYEKTKRAQVTEEILVDKKLSIDELDRSLWDMVSLLAPFGVLNPKPLFLFPRETVKKVRKFGKRQEHCELLFEKGDGTPVRALSFFASGATENIQDGDTVSLVANLEKSFFGGRAELRLRIIDLTQE